VDRRKDYEVASKGRRFPFRVFLRTAPLIGKAIAKAQTEEGRKTWTARIRARKRIRKSSAGHENLKKRNRGREGGLIQRGNREAGEVITPPRTESKNF